jgi:integrase
MVSELRKEFPMSIYLRGDTYWLNVSGPDRRQVRVSAHTRNPREAQLLENELRLKLWAASVPVIDITGASASPASMLFEQLAEEFQNYQTAIGRKSAGRFFRIQIGLLKTEFKGLKLSDLDMKKIEAYRLQKLAKTSAATANRSISVLRRMLTLAVRWGYLDRNPAAGLERLKAETPPHRVLTPAEQDAYLRACRDDFRLFAWVLLHTGMRRGELSGLKAREVDSWRSQFTLPTSKSGKVRHIPVPPKVMEALGKRLGSLQPADLVFVDQRGCPWTDTVVRRCHANAVKDARLEWFRIHDLRHTFAMDFLASCGDVHLVQSVLGHSSVKVTEHYLSRSMVREHAAMAVYGQNVGSYDTNHDTKAGKSGIKARKRSEQKIEKS